MKTHTKITNESELQGVGVLNLHRLADLVRVPVLPGERIKVAVTKVGRERGQGVGYLEDGTMVVVEGASDRVGAELEVEVTSVLQQDTGRLLFAKLPDHPGPGLREVR
jgi:uncharacterized protein YacL